MKYRESGMPDESLWDTFFTPTEILQQMGIGQQVKVLIDVGCGYGTFLVPAAGMVRDKVVGIDIDPAMIDICRQKVRESGLAKIELVHGDIATAETLHNLAKYKGQIDYVTLFNILHCEEPITLLQKAHVLLSPGGRIGVIHWKNENTPRGPSMDIRPTPDMIIAWASQVGFDLDRQIDLPPYHFGLVFQKHEKGAALIRQRQL